jgi:hypothetical protein
MPLHYSKLQEGFRNIFRDSADDIEEQSSSVVTTDYEGGICINLS